MAYSNLNADKLYSLLPVYLRERDVENGEPLRALLGIIEKQADAIETDIQKLGENAFIETSENWVIPYIGDLVGTTPLFDENQVRDGNTAGELFPDLTGPSLRPSIGLGNRADVAKTIYYRRRKGTLPMLEELARDVTGWSAHAVEFFELLIWNQWIRNHLRPHSTGTPDLRSIEKMDRLDRAFDEIAHTVDVRHISQHEGWHNIKNIGFFLWRLHAYRMEYVQPRRLGGDGDFRYHFSPLGNSAPLFSRHRREGDETGLATELHVPQPIRPVRFYEDLQIYNDLQVPRPGFTEFYGLFNQETGFNVAPAPSFHVKVDDDPILADNVICRNLSTWSQPPDDKIAIDVELGRLALGQDYLPSNKIEVFYHYGFPANLGGGPYARRAWLTRTELSDSVLIVNGSGEANTFPTINDALNQWVANGGEDTIIRITDNRTYEETIAIDTQPAGGNFLVIEAADETRPHLQLDGPMTLAGDRQDFSFTLGGLLIEGQIEVTGSLGRLRLLHSTVVPGVSIAESPPPEPPAPPAPPAAIPGPSISAAELKADGSPANTEFSLELAFSITGPLRVPVHSQGIYALDSIIDGVGQDAIAGTGANQHGPPVNLERVTARGNVHVRQINLATELIVDGLIRAERIQTGCVRFSYIQPGSKTPRRYRCQPDLAEKIAIAEEEKNTGGALDPLEEKDVRARVRSRVKPEFTAEDYGLPAYLQLSLGGPPEIATGAEDGSEMGVYCHLKQPQRESNLKIRLGEYLPFGLEYGIIYVT
ncbi:MAG: hypothetical protein G3M70_11155 [Candidatus Nitronauta litoralis]|uniref:Uncharacterized protein n=1 Tax=Candidatus Nitronauta litoralis TaxID=2705533 RepID=A0A7T0BWT3_9BACT|nr:MAG: hypothetical protein G3M70_11155 [Candidatus Nitronauta litoralis]